MSRRENNNYGLNRYENTGRRKLDGSEKEEKYVDENFNTTDSDAAEISPRVKQASQETGNAIEEGDEDYDDEEKGD